MHFQPKADTYVADTSFGKAWLTYDEGADYYDSHSGTFKLTTCDTVNTKIDATFDFKGYSPTGATKSITEGSLSLTKLTKQ